MEVLAGPASKATDGLLGWSRKDVDVGGKLEGPSQAGPGDFAGSFCIS